MNEETIHATFANDYRAFTSIQSVSDTVHPRPNVLAMAGIGGLIFAVWFGLVATFAVRSTLRSRKFRRERALLRQQPVLAQVAFICLLLVAVVNASLKNLPAILSFSATSSGIVFVDETQGDPVAEPLDFTESQELAGFALAAVSTNEAFDLSVPTNAIVHEPWRRRGAARDGFWTTLDPPFLLGTNVHASVYVSSSGTLSFDRRKGSPFPRPMPDGSSIAFLAPLQTSLGIVPEANWGAICNQQSAITNSLFWHDTTDAGAHRFTWLNALLNRDASQPVSFQVELLPDGDFVYRYDLDAITNRQSAMTNYVVGAQNNTAGETAMIATADFRCTDTNHLCATVYGLDSLDGTNILSAPLCTVVSNAPKFTLRWTNIANLDISTTDPDGDGISSAEEVLVHHTDPESADTDGDGLSDFAEISTGTSALDPDSDDDGIPDGLDPQPAVWNDAQADADGDGIGLADELLNGLDPAVDDSVDTDGDGWEDWKEILAGTSSTDYDQKPLNADGSARIFSATFAPSATPTATLSVSVGDRRMVFGPGSTSARTLWLREGVAYPVALYAASDCAASLTCALGSDCATFQNPHPVFEDGNAAGGTLLGGKTTDSGLIAQPAIAIDPDHLCFHVREALHVEASVLPPELAGSWSWWMPAGDAEGTDSQIDMPYDETAYYPTALVIQFLAEGAAEPRTFAIDATRCSRLDDPDWPPSETATTQWDPPHDPFHVEDPVDGEPALHGPDQETDGGAGLDVGLVVSVNNDDDGGNATSLDVAVEDLPVADNDLVAYHPFGLYDGTCCPCPEHRPRYADVGELVSISPRLALWDDPCKSNAFSGAIHAAEPVYVEGLSESASPGADRIVWRYVDGDSETHVVTNAFTVLSQRIFADLDFDGDVETDDKALHPALSSEHGWIVPVDTNAFRKVQLRTDVDLPGIHVLTLSGDAFKVWQSDDPAPTNTPLLVSGQSVTNGVDDVSWGTDSTATLYVQSVNSGVSTLTYAYIGTGEAAGIVCRASMKMTAMHFGIVPDYDRDRGIDWRDQAQCSTNRVLRWWINDDDDNGTDVAEGANDVPGQGYGLTTVSNDTQWPDSETVDGRCDLLDFFPLWLDLGDLLAAFPANGTYALRLSQADSAVRMVYTDLCATNAGAYLVSAVTNCGPDFAQAAYEAETFLVDDGGVELEQEFVDRILADPQKGVLMVEGRAETQSPLVLEILRNGVRVAMAQLPLRISGVEDMYRWINLRPSASSYYPSRTNEPPNRPDSETIDKTAFLAHGFLVPQDEARGWASECFKRLYQSGMTAKFCGVSWYSDQGTSADYYLNVQSARDTAAQLSPIVNAMPGEKVWMAHSLGNMLSGYAIADDGMNVDKYFALNAAVAAEAYDVSTVDESDSTDNYMQHENWLGYSNRTWASGWFKLFSSGDDRSKLTWRNRFTNVLDRTQMYNFWSSGDEVLEIGADGTPYVSDILLGTLDIFDISGIDTRAYVWHKQELYKGRNLIYGTGWAGWGFEYPTWQTADGANASTDDTLRQYPIFERDPDFMFTNVITQAHVDDILIKGIPALSWPVGRTNIATIVSSRNIDMDINNSDNILRPNGWPVDDTYGNRWLHSQLVYVAHFYAHKLYEKFIEIGGLK